jgi:tetratricopeptide (TPR) repeat protein
LRDYEGALADFDKAIAHKSDDAYAYNNRGSCKMKMKDY